METITLNNFSHSTSKLRGNFLTSEKYPETRTRDRIFTVYRGEEPWALTDQFPKAFHHSASEWPELSDQSEVRK